MWIPEKMMVNKFQDVAIPENKLFFSRLGEVSPTPDRYTGDEVAPMNQSKIDEIEAYRQYAMEEAKKSESNESNK